jgi:hypothetical protein
VLLTFCCQRAMGLAGASGGPLAGVRGLAARTVSPSALIVPLGVAIPNHGWVCAGLKLTEISDSGRVSGSGYLIAGCDWFWRAARMSPEGPT